MSYSEVKNLPIEYRRWFLKRLVRDFEERNKQEKDSSNKEKNYDMSKFDAFEKNVFKKLKK
jgi:hypothetical protein